MNLNHKEATQIQETEMRTHHVRINYPEADYAFGIARSDIPVSLSETFSDHLQNDYLNLTNKPIIGSKNISLSEDDCMYLAKLFANFTESPSSIVRQKAYYRAQQSVINCPKNLKRTILAKYFGITALENKPAPDEWPFYDPEIDSLFNERLKRASMGLIMSILGEFGLDLPDIDALDAVSFMHGNFEMYYENNKPRIVNGIPSFVKKSEGTFIVRLRGHEKKILLLNSDYVAPGKDGEPGYYKCSSEPNIVILTPEEFCTCGGVRQLH